MKALLYIVCCLCISIPSWSQLKDLELNSKIEKLDNYYEIETTIINHFNEKRKSNPNDESLRSAKKYWRMMYEMRDKIDGEGNILNNLHLLKVRGEEEALRLNESTSSERSDWNGNWFIEGYNNVSNPASSFGIGRVDRLAISPTNSSTLIAGTPNGGLYRTTNAGASWIPLPEFGPSLGVSEIVYDKFNTNTIYVVSGNADNGGGGFVNGYGYGRHCRGIFKSTDNGATWFQTDSLGFEQYSNFFCYHMVQSPDNQNEFLVASNYGLFKTTNGGSSWTRIRTRHAWDVKYLGTNSNNIIATELFYTSSGYRSMISISNNGGSIFTVKAFYGLTDMSGYLDTISRGNIAISPVNSNLAVILFGKSSPAAGVCDGYGTYDLGSDTYTAFNPGLNLFAGNSGSDDGNQSTYNNCISISPETNLKFITGGLTLFRTNSGTSAQISTYFYDPAQPTKYVHSDIHDVKYASSSIVYAAGDGGVWKSIDGGTSWSFASLGITSNQFYHGDISLFDNNYFIGGLQDNGTKLRTTNSLTMQHIYGCDGFDALFDPTNKNHLLFDCNESTVRQRPDGSQVGCDLVEPGAFFANLAFHPTDPSIIYLGKQWTYKSIDTGAVFSITNGGLRPSQFDIATCPSNINRIYIAGVVGTNKTMWRSDNGGDTWINVSSNANFPTNSDYGSIKSIVVSPINSSSVVVTFGGYFEGLKVFHSNNAGGTWTNISHNLPNVPTNTAAFANNGDLYVGNDFGVYHLPVAKLLTGPYKPFLNNLPRVPISELKINTNNNKIVAFTFGRGFYSSTLSPVSCDPTLVLSTNHVGRQYYEASTDIVSTSNIVAGSATYTYYKAGGFANLTPGFDAGGGANLSVNIAPCGSEFTFENNLQHHSNGSRNGKIVNLPNQPMLTINGQVEGGVITNVKNDEVEIKAHQQGLFQVKILDENNIVIDESEPIKINESDKNIFTSMNLKEGSFALLYYNSYLVGFQEITK